MNSQAGKMICAGMTKKTGRSAFRGGSIRRAIPRTQERHCHGDQSNTCPTSARSQFARRNAAPASNRPAVARPLRVSARPSRVCQAGRAPWSLGVPRLSAHPARIPQREDAFQATFFVLARKAQALGKKEGLGPWLYGVASRIALHARADAARRYQREQRAESRGPADPYAEVTGRELCAVLEEELNRLPERYRTPFRLCYVEGQTRDQAAGQLGGSLRTLHRRLEHGRKLLQAALTRRGVTLAAALVATDLIQRSTAATLTAFLRLATVKAALHFAGALRSESVSLSAQAVTLAQSVLQGMALAKITIAGMALLALALGTTSVGLMVHSSASHQSQTLSWESQPASPPPALASTEPRGDSGARVDLLGDPLPAGALARLGSSRWRLDSSGADALVCSSDGETLVTANPTTGITLWDMATGKAVSPAARRYPTTGMVAGRLGDCAGSERPGRRLSWA